MPKNVDLLAVLNGGKKFSKLDLSYVYQEVLLHEDSKELLHTKVVPGQIDYSMG